MAVSYSPNLVTLGIFIDSQGFKVFSPLSFEVYLFFSISSSPSMPSKPLLSIFTPHPEFLTLVSSTFISIDDPTLCSPRSEERRVGKECSSRWVMESDEK